MSLQQVMFFNKNAADYDDPAVLVTATQGNAFAPAVQRRSNQYGWITTGSVDADNTTMTLDFVGQKDLTDIILVGHNFKAFTIKYWNGAAYVNFSTPINAAGIVTSVNRFSFTLVSTTKIQLIITGTQVANSDKYLNQFIATSLIGQLSGWPVIKKPTFDLNKRINTMLSGKKFIGINVGGFSCSLSVKIWSSSADLAIIEALYSYGDGFLVWLCGGNETQFSSVREGYRLKDIFLMKCEDNYTPEWANGLYQSGLVVDMALTEVTS